jgi:hypothetical protein
MVAREALAADIGAFPAGRAGPYGPTLANREGPFPIADLVSPTYGGEQHARRLHARRLRREQQRRLLRLRRRGKLRCQ